MGGSGGTGDEGVEISLKTAPGLSPGEAWPRPWGRAVRAAALPGGLQERNLPSQNRPPPPPGGQPRPDAPSDPSAGTCRRARSPRAAPQGIRGAAGSPNLGRTQGAGTAPRTLSAPRPRPPCARSGPLTPLFPPGSPPGRAWSPPAHRPWDRGRAAPRAGHAGGRAVLRGHRSLRAERLWVPFPVLLPAAGRLQR